MFEEAFRDFSSTFYFTPATMRSFLAGRGLAPEVVESLLGEFESVGFVVIDDRRFVCCLTPCRYCGGTGRLLVVKFSGYMYDSCDRCGGKGYIVDVDDDTVLE